MAIWRIDPLVTSYESQILEEDGVILARMDDFGYAAYPMALNVKHDRVERGGAYRDRAEAKLWAERVAGLHPEKPGDERPAFYYSPDEKS